MDNLCLTVKVDGWERGQAPERIRLQAALTETVETACRRSGFTLPASHGVYSSQGRYLALHDGTESLVSVPSLIRELATALAAANRSQPVDGRLRVWLVLTTSLVLPPGVAGRAVAEGLRLAASEPVRAALRPMPKTDLAVVVSDTVFRDVIAKGLLTLRPDQCSPIRLNNGFSPIAWLHIPNRSGRNPPGAGVDHRAPERTKARDETMAHADRLVNDGDVPGAVRLLEDALRRPSAGVGPWDEVARNALLLLGDCHLRLGDLESAVQTWMLLLTRDPLDWTACQRLGRLERHRGRTDLAAIYLGEGLRLIRTHPERCPEPHRLACALLLDLAQVEEDRGDQTAAGRRLNEAAEADPQSPLPLVSLAYRAARRADVQTARRLLDAAITRIPMPNRPDFQREQSEIAVSRQGGAVIIELLQEVAHRQQWATRR